MATNTFSSLAGYLRTHNNITNNIPAPQSLLQHPKLAAALALTTLLTLSTPALFSRARSSYRGFLALGPGGLPHNLLGWAIQGALQLIARSDTRDPAPFAEARNQGGYEPHGATSFLELGPGVGKGEGEGEGGGGRLPRRRGDRPDVPGYVAPQRQMTQLGGTADMMRARMAAHLGDLAARNPGLLVLKPSGLEGKGGPPALWLDCGDDEGDDDDDDQRDQNQQEQMRRKKRKPAVPPYMRHIRGEMAHVHPEASSHVTVSMADAGELVRKGWAERHRLSGVLGLLPWGYVMVYAPRDEVEFGIWKAVVAAGARFVCAGSGREVVV